jgi:GTP-binding protein
MDARFVRSCPDPGCFPDPLLPELAIAGRSNCGKSSLINALTGRTRLARTSSTPGRTQQVVFFQLTLPGAPPFSLVDLPGYGYAKVSKSMRRAWGQLVTHYIEERPTLQALLLLIDARRASAQEEDDLLRWSGDRGLELRVVLTKSDKLKKNQRFGVAQAAKRSLGLSRTPLLFSIRDDASVEALRELVASLTRPGD